MTDQVGQLVDAFLADHGRVHVGDEQPFSPTGRFLDHDVDRAPRQRVAHPIDEGAVVVFAAGVKDNVRCNARVEPFGFAGRRQDSARVLERGIVERAVT